MLGGQPDGLDQVGLGLGQRVAGQQTAGSQQVVGPGQAGRVRLGVQNGQRFFGPANHFLSLTGGHETEAQGQKSPAGPQTFLFLFKTGGGQMELLSPRFRVTLNQKRFTQTQPAGGRGV